MIVRKLLSCTVVLGATLIAATAVQADNLRIEFTIENLTHAITFRPFLIAAHPADSPVFRAGQPATPGSDFSGVQLMAECGNLESDQFANLVDRMTQIGADFVANPVDLQKPFDPPLGLLFPAGTTEGQTAVPFGAGLPGSVSGTLHVTTRQNTHLSVVAMLLPTNDGFAGLDSFPIPRRPGTHVLHLPAYDAGTEANNELPADENPLDCVPDEAGYPVDPLGNDGTGGAGVTPTEVTDRVHIHRNHLGDLEPNGGISDLDSSVHRWLNPVIKLTITVKPGRRGRN